MLNRQYYHILSMICFIFFRVTSVLADLKTTVKVYPETIVKADPETIVDANQETTVDANIKASKSRLVDMPALFFIS